MKFNKKVIFLPAIALLTACGGGGGGGGGTSQRDRDATLLVHFYSDYNHFEEGESYLDAWWYYNRPIDKDKIGLKDPTEAPDPYYPTFLGWSLHPIVDEEQYLWDFTTDVVTEDMAVGGEIEFFGIYVG